eukprot:COSAG02_NODE_5209_length_4540_cov_13.058771_2_plen_169_part_00
MYALGHVNANHHGCGHVMRIIFGERALYRQRVASSNGWGQEEPLLHEISATSIVTLALQKQNKQAPRPTFTERIPLSIILICSCFALHSLCNQHQLGMPTHSSSSACINSLSTHYDCTQEAKPQREQAGGEAESRAAAWDLAKVAWGAAHLWFRTEDSIKFACLVCVV